VVDLAWSLAASDSVKAGPRHGGKQAISKISTRPGVSYGVPGFFWFSLSFVTDFWNSVTIFPTPGLFFCSELKQFDLWLACHTQEKIAEMVGVTQPTVLSFIKSFQEQVLINFTFSEENFKPPIYNIWKVQNKSNKVSHFGNTEAQWLENLLYLYTEPFDIVVDPFAGGGSSIDICKKKLRRYYLSHLHASVNGCREQSKKKKSATRKRYLIYGSPATLRKRLRRLLGYHNAQCPILAKVSESKFR